jgi:hypothetical protein
MDEGLANIYVSPKRYSNGQSTLAVYPHFVQLCYDVAQFSRAGLVLYIVGLTQQGKSKPTCDGGNRYSTESLRFCFSMALYRHAYCRQWEDTTVRFQATMMCCTVGDHTFRALSRSPTPFSLQTRSEGSALRLEHGLPGARVRFHRQWSDCRGPGRE